MLFNYKNPIIVAEIGCNHKGDMKVAEQLIISAAKCGANYAKFQKEITNICLEQNIINPHPVLENSYGKTYGEHRDKLEFSIADHIKLSKICKNIVLNMQFLFKKISALKLIQSKIKLDYLKVPSACNWTLNY